MVREQSVSEYRPWPRSTSVQYCSVCYNLRVLCLFLFSCFICVFFKFFLSCVFQFIVFFWGGFFSCTFFWISLVFFGLWTFFSFSCVLGIFSIFLVFFLVFSIVFSHRGLGSFVFG